MRYNQATFKELCSISGLRKSEKLILNAIASFTPIGKEDSTCFPSVSSIMQLSSCSKTTVFRCLKSLEHAGLIHRAHRFRDDGGLTSNHYVINVDEEAIAKASFFLSERKRMSNTNYSSSLDKNIQLNIEINSNDAKEIKTETVLTEISCESMLDNNPLRVPHNSQKQNINFEKNMYDSNEFVSIYELVSNSVENIEDAFMISTYIIEEEKIKSGQFRITNPNENPLDGTLIDVTGLPMAPLDMGKIIANKGEEKLPYHYNGISYKETVDLYENFHYNINSSYWYTPFGVRQMDLGLPRKYCPNPSIGLDAKIIWQRMPLLFGKSESELGRVWAWKRVSPQCVQNGVYVNDFINFASEDEIRNRLEFSMIDWRCGLSKNDIEAEKKIASKEIKDWFINIFYPKTMGCEYVFQGVKDGSQLKNIVRYIYDILLSKGVPFTSKTALGVFKRILTDGYEHYSQIHEITISVLSSKFNTLSSNAFWKHKESVNAYAKDILGIYNLIYNTEQRLLYRHTIDFNYSMRPSELHVMELYFIFALGLPLDYFYEAPYFSPYPIKLVNEMASKLSVSNKSSLDEIESYINQFNTGTYLK